MITITLAVVDLDDARVSLCFENEGNVVAYLDRRMACLGAIVPVGAFQLSALREHIGASFSSRAEERQATLALSPGESVSTEVRLGDVVARAGERIHVRYAASHRNLDTGEIDEVTSNAVELVL